MSVLLALFALVALVAFFPFFPLFPLSPLIVLILTGEAYVSIFVADGELVDEHAEAAFELSAVFLLVAVFSKKVLVEMELLNHCWVFLQL